MKKGYFTDQRRFDLINFSNSIHKREDIENIINWGKKVGISSALINERDDTALHIAVRISNVSLIKRLIEEKADANLQNKYGNTALHMACTNFYCKSDNFEIIKLLVENGASVHPENEFGFTALQAAITNNKSEDYLSIIEFLLSKGANPNHQNSKGDTASHKAVQMFNVKALELLAKYNADFTIQNKSGYNPLDFIHKAYPFYKRSEKLEYKQVESFLSEKLQVDIENNADTDMPLIAATQIECEL